MEDYLEANKALLATYIFETKQLIEETEGLLLEAEKQGVFSGAALNAIFRSMHTIKGSSATLGYKELASLAHHLEDSFTQLKAGKIVDLTALNDLLLASLDLIKAEIEALENGEIPTTSTEELCQALSQLFDKTLELKSEKQIGLRVYFQEGAGMENIRAYNIKTQLEASCKRLICYPKELIEAEISAIEAIKQKGFWVEFNCPIAEETIKEVVEGSLFIDHYEILPFTSKVEQKQESVHATNRAQEVSEEKVKSIHKEVLVSVNIGKLDKLMDYIGELVITQAMVLQNPDLSGLELPSFNKASRALVQLTDEIEKVVMSLHMMPMTLTFHRMERIVRDVSKKLGKEVKLIVKGENEEVDKQLIEGLNDPLMHLVRNAVDHGIELPEERIKAGKAAQGIVTLEIENTGGEVILRVKDDGKGLDKEKILKKARDKGYISAHEVLNDKDIYQFIVTPGFSTKEGVTEISGRGVGLDVVSENLKQLGGQLQIESEQGVGTSFVLKLPLTLAIISGLIVRGGASSFIIPIHRIQEITKVEMKEVFESGIGKAYLIKRGMLYPIRRLNQWFRSHEEVLAFNQGMMVLIKSEEGGMISLFVDEIVGEQQVVIKSLPHFMNPLLMRAQGIGGCSILSDGSISLILDL